MKKLGVVLALMAASAAANASGRDVAAGVLLGVLISNQPRVLVQSAPVYIPPQPVYAPNPNYPQVYPVPRVITFSEPCHYYGQMVMTFDQWNQPIGYRNCR